LSLRNFFEDKTKSETHTKASPNTHTTTSVNPNKLSIISMNIISFIFENGGATISEVCEFLGKPKNYVSRYLYNLRNYGLVSKIYREWSLTNEGVKVLELFYKTKMAKKYYKNKGMKDSEAFSSSFIKFHTIKNKTNKEEEIKKKVEDLFYILENKMQISFSFEEEVVVRELLAHSLKTGMKYMLFPSEGLNPKSGLVLSPLHSVGRYFGMDVATIGKVITNLCNKGVIYYIETRNSMGMTGKIGIKKDLYDYLVNKQFELSVIGDR